MKVEDLAIRGGCDVDGELGECVPVLLAGTPVEVIEPDLCGIGKPVSGRTEAVLGAVGRVMGIIEGGHPYNRMLGQA